MKRISKLFYAGLVMMLCAFFLLPVQASEPSAGLLLELPDPTQSVDFTIDCELEGVKLKGVEAALYHVADMVNTDPMEFVLAEDFTTYPLALKGLTKDQWNIVCTTLNSYIVADGQPPLRSGVSDGNGVVSFDGLTCGMYLVRFEDHEQDGYIYHGSPLLVYLPDFDYDIRDWNYTVRSFGKFTREKVPEEEFVNRKVIKIWDDKGCEEKRPKEIIVNLYKDGVLYESVKLNEANQWCYEWDKLPAGSTYEMTEKVVEGYTVTITKDGTAYTVKNTRKPDTPPTEEPTQPTTTPHKPPTPTPPKTTPPKLPQTGQMWWPVAALGGCGLLLMLVGASLRKVKKHE